LSRECRRLAAVVDDVVEVEARSGRRHRAAQKRAKPAVPARRVGHANIGIAAAAAPAPPPYGTV
jgi:hypothetical protein